MYEIRKSTLEDVETIMSMFDAARKYMIASGNPTQWPIGSPSRESVIHDISKEESFMIMSDGIAEATFCCQKGADPTYSYIEDGQWPDNKPYVTIHRVASYGRKSGIGIFLMKWCQDRYDVIRCDTHRDNHKMQSIILACGFVYCGIIYIKDGTQRLAYQWNKK